MLQIERSSIVDRLPEWCETFIRFLRHHPQPGWELAAFASQILQLRVLLISVGLGFTLGQEIFSHLLAVDLAPHHKFQARVLVSFEAKLVVHASTVAIFQRPNGEFPVVMSLTGHDPEFLGNPLISLLPE